VYGLVVAGLLGGTAAWAATGKSVDLRVDGRDQQVRTSAADVQGVLGAAGIKVGEHDLLAPDLQAPIKDGAEIVVRRGHLLHLSVNGVATDVWVNADSVSEAMSQLGYDSSNLVSVSRAARLDESATSLSIDSPKHLTFKVAGKSIAVLSAGPTVYQAITDGGIFLGPGDRLSAAGLSKIHDKQVIQIQRATLGKLVQQVAVAFQTVQHKDASAYAGTETVLSQGGNGISRVTYQLVYLDGKFAGKLAQHSVTFVKPIVRIVRVGTRPAPDFVVNSPAGAQHVAAAMVAARGWGGDEFSCLSSLWSKESGWRTDAANPSGAYGIPQSLPGEKMASAGADWQTNAATQITWGLGYIEGIYGTPCAAWGHSQATNWY
jgi:uncharacterized protein YabE (DUF348 family)